MTRNKSSFRLYHYLFFASDKHLAVNLCAALKSQIDRKGSLIFEPVIRLGHPAAMCKNCKHTMEVAVR